jgi:hypothetical protein
MTSINQRGDTFRITVNLGYGMDGKPIRKIATFKPPQGANKGEARKLAEAFARDFEKKCADSHYIEEEGMN